jgi:hypothetical protein
MFKLVESDVASSFILLIYVLLYYPFRGREFLLKKEDIIIYACVIVGAGIGLLFDNAIPGVLIGLGIGYLLKALFFNKINKG